MGIGTDPNTTLHVQGPIRAEGPAFATTFNPTSSRELKEQIRPLSAEEAVQTLENLDPVSFYFKADEKKEQLLGFIAEDVPEVISTEDRKAIHSTNIVAVLTKVVQKQRKRIASMENRLMEIDALEARLEALEALPEK